ncbi:hypothetical protein Syun_019040 [Stephania yunnanensis]|uniref:Uncharacterized protein n=1 Tax=Stephania yunnanensis TaxID=152371 RepID=A0AAP0ITC9_9MAGN
MGGADLRRDVGLGLVDRERGEVRSFNAAADLRRMSSVSLLGDFNFTHSCCGNTMVFENATFSQVETLFQVQRSHTNSQHSKQDSKSKEKCVVINEHKGNYKRGAQVVQINEYGCHRVKVIELQQSWADLGPRKRQHLLNIDYRE